MTSKTVSPTILLTDVSGHETVLHWSGRDVPDGQLSLPDILDNNLREVRAEHASLVYNLSRLVFFGKEVQEWLKCGSNLSMWWCSLLYERHPRMTPNLYPIYKLYCLEKILAQTNTTKVICRGLEKNIEDMIRSLCVATGRSFISSDSITAQKNIGLKSHIYWKIPAPFRACVRFCHWLFTVRRKLPFAGYKSLADRQDKNNCDNQVTATIATYFPNLDMEAAKHGRLRSRYWENLHDALCNAAGSSGRQFVHWLFIRFPSPQLTLDDCIKFRNKLREQGLDGLSFHYLEEFLNTSDIFAALWRHLRLCLASLLIAPIMRKNSYFSKSKLNIWPLLASDYAESFRGWRCLERCIQNQAFIRFAKMAGPQIWTLFPLENCPWERMLTNAMHSSLGKEQVPVYGAQHSSLRPTDFRYFDDARTFIRKDTNLFQPDKIFGNGNSACSQLREAGVPEERLGQVEALRYLYLANKKKVTGSKISTLLVVTSFFKSETAAHLDLLAKALASGILDKYSIILKPHPYLPTNDWLNDQSREVSNKVKIAEGPISSVLTPGTLVWASNSTTVSLEAAINGLPVMVMPPDNDFDLCPIQDVTGLVRTSTLADVEHGINSAKPLDLPVDYLDLDISLNKWKKLLNL